MNFKKSNFKYKYLIIKIFFMKLLYITIDAPFGQSEPFINAWYGGG